MEWHSTARRAPSGRPNHVSVFCFQTITLSVFLISSRFGGAKRPSGRMALPTGELRVARNVAPG